MSELPRAMSSNDDVFKEHWSRYSIKVFVDGVEQRDVQSYDIDDGSIVKLKKDRENKPLISGDTFVTETVRGVVTVSANDIQSR